MKTTAFGNGLSVANDWSDDGRLASWRLYRTSAGTNLSWLSYVYDRNDTITAINDQLNAANNIIYGYDPNDRLNLTATGAAGTTSTDTYNYTTGTNRLSSVVNSGGTRAITYDGRGNTATESRPGSVSASTTYDGYGRLTGYTRTDVGARTFVYNGRDDRVSATSSVGTRRFVYDADGRVLGEYGASATDVKAEFIWALPQVANDNARFGGDDGAGGYMPLVVATPNSAGTIVLNWVHGNHLGVPIVTTDTSGNTATTPNDYLQPGFPGQSRTIADLYYNRYRDYDPNLGRYIQADPIGLKGGQNDYDYAANNPIRWNDPWGLQSSNLPLDPRKLPPPGTCSWLDYLNRTADKALQCHNPLNPIRRCLPEMSCDELQDQVNRRMNCADARQKVMQCFGGGDKAHNDHVDQLMNGVNTCQNYMITKGCGCPQWNGR